MSNNIVEVLYMVESPAPGIPSKNMCESMRRSSAPVVRCMDCKDYRASDQTCHSWQWHNWDAAIEVDPDGFCAWGERKD